MTHHTQETRAMHIKQIENSIKAIMEENPEKHVDYKHAIIAAMSSLNVSKRVAAEYVDVAFYNLSLTK